MTTEIAAINDDSFKDQVLRSEIPVLVDFWASWCQPCLRLAPVLEEIAIEYREKLKFFKMNVETNQATPAKYDVRGIPALLLFKDGNVVATRIGGDASKLQLATFLDSHL